MAKLNYSKLKKVKTQDFSSGNGTYIPENTPNRNYWVKVLNKEFNKNEKHKYLNKKSKATF